MAADLQIVIIKRIPSRAEALKKSLYQKSFIWDLKNPQKARRISLFADFFLPFLKNSDFFTAPCYAISRYESVRILVAI